MIVVIHEFWDQHCANDKTVTRELTPLEIARGHNNWGRAVSRLHRRDWRRRRFGSGYTRTRIQDESGMAITPLAEFGERV